MRKWEGKRGISLFIGNKEGYRSDTDQPESATWWFSKKTKRRNVQTIKIKPRGNIQSV